MWGMTEGTVKLMKIQIPLILHVPRRHPWGGFHKGKVGLTKCLYIPLHPLFCIPGQKLKFIKPTGYPSRRHYFTLGFGRCCWLNLSSCWLNRLKSSSVLYGTSTPNKNQYCLQAKSFQLNLNNCLITAFSIAGVFSSTDDQKICVLREDFG